MTAFILNTEFGPILFSLDTGAHIDGANSVVSEATYDRPDHLERMAKDLLAAKDLVNNCTKFTGYMRDYKFTINGKEYNQFGVTLYIIKNDNGMPEWRFYVTSYSWDNPLTEKAKEKITKAIESKVITYIETYMNAMRDTYINAMVESIKNSAAKRMREANMLDTFIKTYLP